MKRLLALLMLAYHHIKAIQKPSTEVDQTEAQQEWEAELLASEETKKILSLNKLQAQIPQLIEAITPVTQARVDAFYLKYLKDQVLESIKTDTLSAKAFIDLYSHAIKPKLKEGDSLRETEEAALWIQRLDNFSIIDVESDFLEEIINLLTLILTLPEDC